MAHCRGFPSAGNNTLVQRRETELVHRAGPTPHEFKKSSDVDDQEAHRFHALIHHQ